MSGTSNVGGPGVYEAGDQRNVKDSELNERDRYKEGKENSHLANDSSKYLCMRHYTVGTFGLYSEEDERSIANKLARESKVSPSCLP